MKQANMQQQESQKLRTVAKSPGHLVDDLHVATNIEAVEVGIKLLR